MEKNDFGKEKIPTQLVGSAMDAVESVELASDREAIEFFQLVKARFFDVNGWGNIAKLPLSTFVLTDHAAVPVKRWVKEGDFIRIDIPGPGNHTGGGYDWVEVEEISEEKSDDKELITLKARPSPNPQSRKDDIAHFYTDAAVSTFQIKRIGNKVFAEEHGRNELANSDTESTLDNIRNTVVGWAAKLGFSYPQWKSLVKGWVER